MGRDLSFTRQNITKNREFEFAEYICEFEHLFPKNLYYNFVVSKKRLPNPSEAASIGSLMGSRVRACDGKKYPKPNAAEKEYHKQASKRRAEFHELCQKRSMFTNALQILAELEIEATTLSLNGTEWQHALRDLPEALSCLNRFAERIGVSAPRKSSSHSPFIESDSCINVTQAANDR
jgi:hypothetical protein